MKAQYTNLDRDNKLIWNFRDIGHTMRRISEGKGSQKRILIILLESGCMTQKALTHRLGIQPGSASEAIGKLENAGLIVRTPSADDHRTTDIALTLSGKEMAKSAYARRRERHVQMFESLSEGEKDVLIQLLEKINGDWDQKYRSQDGE